MLNYFNYFNLSLTLDDNLGNKLFAHNNLLELSGDMEKVSKLLIEYYINLYDIKSNEYRSHYLNNCLFVEHFKLHCTADNISNKFSILCEEFEKQIQKYILL